MARDPRVLAHPTMPMTGRDPRERNRVGSSLELLFDLTFAVSFGVAGNEFSQLMAAGDIGHGLFGFSFAMFAIMWAWVNFTWFASAFDTDDWVYRVTTLVQMIGVVVLALGLTPFFASLAEGGVDNLLMVLGYVVMRLAMLFQWLRVARQSPRHRRAALVYASTLGFAQVGWTVLALAHTSWPTFVGCGVGLLLVELSGPLVAETRAGGTPWHPTHIAERYGALALITLGEGIVGTIAALAPVIATVGWTFEAVLVVTAGLCLTFGLWWGYFAIDFGAVLAARPDKSFAFGYGHMLIFAAIAATGAGMHVAGYVLAGEARLGNVAAVASVVGPLLLFMVVLVGLYSYLFGTFDRLHAAMVAGLVAVLAAALGLAAMGVPMGWCLLVASAAPVLMVVVYELEGHRHHSEHLARVRARVGL